MKKKKVRDPIGTQRRFQILNGDGFVCQYCGARPGNDQLNVAHMFPFARGGTDHDNNLTTACVKCNNGMGVLICVPAALRTGETEKDGWIVWKRWGRWILAIDPEGESMVLTFVPLDYWIPIERIHESNWHSHLSHKPWMKTRRGDTEIDSDFAAENWMDFCDGIAFARTLISKDRE